MNSSWCCGMVRKCFEFNLNIWGWFEENNSQFERIDLLSRYSESNFNE
jgi:hypothetical protein